MKNIYLQKRTHQIATTSRQTALSRSTNFLIVKNKEQAFTNISLNQNIGKGPPGRTRGPGEDTLLYPGGSIILEKI